ncbi:unnamed protein product [Lactuca virosa]|uniref:Secreted protein n=1 Tax=Lactuca virosa TaxID=75947 RepID=A0AAU9PDS3_9ASTR|nr:unnamed protein product [Lactuca virosa]
MASRMRRSSISRSGTGLCWLIRLHVCHLFQCSSSRGKMEVSFELRGRFHSSNSIFLLPPPSFPAISGRSAADAPPERLIGAHWRKLLASSVFSIGFRRNSWTCNHFFRNSVRAGR